MGTGYWALVALVVSASACAFEREPLPDAGAEQNGIARLLGMREVLAGRAAPEPPEGDASADAGAQPPEQDASADAGQEPPEQDASADARAEPPEGDASADAGAEPPEQDAGADAGTDAGADAGAEPPGQDAGADAGACIPEACAVCSLSRLSCCTAQGACGCQFTPGSICDGQ